ncbi:hypothetical protein IFM89_002860 [Coptis chinensis]|uniref:Uncharacterized protein n=1 Tax=Coptis chinensis TaxID=261450 RepID=A0A835LE30_9MAGN|nr:hypothetical protein IFM89_002860 [Coptis chinensis]
MIITLWKHQARGTISHGGISNMGSRESSVNWTKFSLTLNGVRNNQAGVIRQFAGLVLIIVLSLGGRNMCLNQETHHFDSLRCGPSHPGFLKLVEKSWAEPLYGHSMFVLCQKLKRLKRRLEQWNKHDFGHLSTKIKEETIKLEENQFMIEQNSNDEQLSMEMVEQGSVVEALLQQEEQFWKQK